MKANRMTNSRKMHNSWKFKAARWLFPTLLISVFITAFASLVTSDDYSVFGFKVIYVATESMADTLNAGDLILCRKVTATDDISVGDIVVYLANDKSHTVCHRIIGTKDGKYLLKGDNAGYPDKPVEFEQIKYKYVKVILLNILHI